MDGVLDQMPFIVVNGQVKQSLICCIFIYYFVGFPTNALERYSRYPLYMYITSIIDLYTTNDV